MRVILCDVGYSKVSWIWQVFLDMAQKVQVTKEKINKLDLIKIIIFIASKDIIKKKAKGQLGEWENVFANHMSEK